MKDAIKGYLQVHNESLSDKYLGMPTDVGHSKKGTFKYLSDRVWDKVKGWMSKCLSTRGKDVLIKSVAQAISVYSMSCFKLPLGLCDHMKSSYASFGGEANMVRGNLVGLLEI